jgi:histidyl-tRNA synthetase
MLVGEREAAATDVVVVPLGDAASARGEGLLADLRRHHIASDMDYRGNMKKRMQRANASGASIAVILGDDELAKGVVILKDLIDGHQHDVPLGDIVDHVYGLLSRQGRGEGQRWALLRNRD